MQLPVPTVGLEPTRLEVGSQIIWFASPVWLELTHPFWERARQPPVEPVGLGPTPLVLVPRRLCLALSVAWASTPLSWEPQELEPAPAA